MDEQIKVQTLKRGSVSICLVLALSACMATTGTRIPAGEYQLSKITKIGISAKKEEEFSLRMSREQMTNTGTVLGGLVGFGIEAGIRSSADATLEDGLKPLVGDFDPTQVLTDKLLRRMQSASVFKQVLPVKSEDERSLKENALDGLLEVTLTQWGLRLCSSTVSGEQVEVALTVHGKVILLGNGNTVWERDEVYREGSCHPVSKFQSQDSYIRQALSGAIDNLAGKIVNDILFP